LTENKVHTPSEYTRYLTPAAAKASWCYFISVAI